MEGAKHQAFKAASASTTSGVSLVMHGGGGWWCIFFSIFTLWLDIQPLRSIKGPGAGLWPVTRPNSAPGAGNTPSQSQAADGPLLLLFRL